MERLDGDGAGYLADTARASDPEVLSVVARLAQQGKLTSKGARDPLLGAAVMQEFREEFRPTNPPPAVQAVAFPALAVVAKVLGRRP